MSLSALSHRAVALCALVLMSATATADVRTIQFTGADQGGTGNYGDWFRPRDVLGELAPVWLSARDSIDPGRPVDPFAPGATGTIYLASYGGGVQDGAGSGSTEISGRHVDSIEEIVITFDRPVITESLVLRLARYNAGSGLDSQDDPVVFVHTTGGGVFTFDEQSGIESHSGQVGVLDLSALLSPQALVTRITLRETRRHVALGALTYTQTLPAPASLALLGLAANCLRRRRRR